MIFVSMCSWGGERNTIDEQLLCGDKTASSPEIILQNYTPLARTSFRDCQPLFVSLMALFHPGPNCLTSLQFEFLLAFLGRSSNIRHQVMLHHQKILRGLRFKFSQKLFFQSPPGQRETNVADMIRQFTNTLACLCAHMHEYKCSLRCLLIKLFSDS